MHFGACLFLFLCIKMHKNKMNNKNELEYEPEIFMNNLRNIILKSKLTLLNISINSDVSYRTIQNIVSGKKCDLKLSTVLKICQALNSDLNSLANIKDKKTIILKENFKIESNGEVYEFHIDY